MNQTNVGAADAASLSLFDDIAPVYEEWFATKLGAFVERRERALLLDLLQLKPGQAILEVGCGTGHFLAAVAAPGIRCVGVEPSGGMLERARGRASLLLCSLARGRGEDLPFRDSVFDALLCMTVLEFVEDLPSAVAEAGRVVRDGGRLVFGVLNAEGPWARQRRREGGLWDSAHFFRWQQLQALLSALGAVKLEFAVFVPPQAEKLPGALLGPLDELIGRLFRTKGALICAQVTKVGAR